METKKIITARSFYLELQDVPSFSKLTSTGIEDDTEAAFKFAEDYAKHVTTPQQQTIERLRGGLRHAITLSDSGEIEQLQTYLFSKAEQLLNTIEPIESEQDFWCGERSAGKEQCDNQCPSCADGV